MAVVVGPERKLFVLLVTIDIKVDDRCRIFHILRHLQMGAVVQKGIDQRALDVFLLVTRRRQDQRRRFLKKNGAARKRQRAQEQRKY